MWYIMSHTLFLDVKVMLCCFDVVLGRQSVELLKCLLLEKIRFTATKFAYKRIFKL